MDIYLDKRAVKQIRLSADEAIEEGDTDTLREDIMEAFTEEQIEEIERRIDSGDFYDFLELPNGLLGIIVGDATGHFESWSMSMVVVAAR